MPLNDFRSVFLPYCLQKQPDGRYAVLNREYKPVGFRTRKYLTYEEYPVLVTLRITPSLASEISWNQSRDTDNVFLYDDSCNPIRSQANMQAYLVKIERLAKLKIPS